MKRTVSLLIVIGMVLSMAATAFADEDREYRTARDLILSEWQELMTKTIGEIDEMAGNEPGFRSGREPDPFPEIPFHTAVYAMVFYSALYYAEYDFDQNGVPELVIAIGDDTHRHILGIYSFDGEQMHYFFRESPLGERVNLMSYDPEEKALAVVSSHGALDNATTIYRFADDGFPPEVEEIESVVMLAHGIQELQGALHYTQLTESDGTPLSLPKA